MEDELPTQREKQEFEAICEQFGVAGQYEMSVKNSRTNQNSIRTVTVRDRKSNAYEIYNGDVPTDSPRFWLQRFSQALAGKTFGNQTEEERAEARTSLFY